MSLTPLRFITCGSVDDGKSTLIGRLLWDSKAVKEDQAATLLQGQGQQNDLGLPDFALLLDGLQAEREQGITIDVAYRYFATEKRAFIVADTPGHEQYTRNMATGASTADLAVLLVDARSGLLEQTRRHATIAALMGIRQFVLAVNKIDLTGYDRAGFERIAGDFRALAQSLGAVDVTAIPTSALKGENVVSRASPAMPWYRGPTLVEALEAAQALRPQRAGFRFPVQRVVRPGENFRGYQGSIACGSVKPGDEVVVLPSGQVAGIREIVGFDGALAGADAGDAVTLVLDRDVDIARGDVIASIDDRPLSGLSFTARIVSLLPEGIHPGRRYWLKSGARRQRVRVTPLELLDLASGEWRPHDAALAVNAIGRVALAFDEAAIFDAYEQSRLTGAFILIDPDSHGTLAGGMISAALAQGERRDGDGERVLLSLPADLADQLLASELLSARRDDVELRRLDAQAARRLFDGIE